MKIFLDDDPRRDHWVDDTWTIVRTAEEVISLLEEGQVSELSLDHDLGPVTLTGYAVAAKLEAWAASGHWFHIPDKIRIHSMNPIGRKNMQAAIDSIERMRNA